MWKRKVSCDEYLDKSLVLQNLLQPKHATGSSIQSISPNCPTLIFNIFLSSMLWSPVIPITQSCMSYFSLHATDPDHLNHLHSITIVILGEIYLFTLCPAYYFWFLTFYHSRSSGFTPTKQCFSNIKICYPPGPVETFLIYRWLIIFPHIM